jgi:hypothetical protein
MYAVLSGAKKNVGDALIVERCVALLRHLKPQQELTIVPSWEPLKTELLRAADALIIPGGPGYQPGFYPGIYPLVHDAERLAVPLVAIGVGWKGIPGDWETLRSYAFTPSSLGLLRVMNERGHLACRDYLTREALARHGLDATMTGCPVWYDLDSIGAPMHRPESIERLVFTPPELPLFADQGIAVAEVLRDLWPNAERICSFHRGIGGVDQWTDPARARNNERLAQAASRLGFEVVDASGALEQIAFYARCDLHVGYRVHAHLGFSGKRRLSVLLHEDGRGAGASQALGVAGLDAFRRTVAGSIASATSRHPMTRWAPLSRLHRRLTKQSIVADETVPAALRTLLEGDLRSNFSRHAGLSARIDAQFAVMSSFIQRLPG